MKYTDASKIKIGDKVIANNDAKLHTIARIENDPNYPKDIFFQSADHLTYHHTALQDPRSFTTEGLAQWYLDNPNTSVYISPNEELGELRYSVVVADSDGFWLDSFQAEAEAVKYIKDHDLTVVGGSDAKVADETIHTEELSEGCDSCGGDEAVYWKDENNNAFVDSRGEILVTAGGKEVRFHVRFCPACGREF